MTEQLPEDVIAYLEERTSGSRSEDPDIAEALLSKYAPKPKTLADMGGSLAWDRRYFRGDGTNPFVEHEHEAGVDGVPWPEVEGIDPRELLNNGWQIRRWLDVPQDWSFAFVSERGVEPSRMWRADIPATPNVIVFCRPPESDNQ